VWAARSEERKREILAPLWASKSPAKALGQKRGGEKFAKLLAAKSDAERTAIMTKAWAGFARYAAERAGYAPPVIVEMDAAEYIAKATPPTRSK
jgi:hypothetical protein